MATARRDFLEEVLAQDSDIDDALDDVVGAFNRLVRENSRSDVINDKGEIDRKTAVILAGFFVILREIIVDHNGVVADIVAQDQFREVQGKYKKVSGLAREITKFRGQVEKFAEETEKGILTRVWADDRKSIATRLKTVETQSIRVVRNIIEVDIRKGKSATEIAKDIQDYVKPLPKGKRISPFQWYRDRFGAKVKALQDGVVPAGSVNYNAFRIARTEINRTYRMSSVLLQKGKPWVRGFKWNLSPAHKLTDECDDFVGVYKDERDLPQPHPNCMCYVTVDLVPISELDL